MILTSSTGGGHDARARALAAWINKLDLASLSQKPLAAPCGRQSGTAVISHDSLDRMFPSTPSAKLHPARPGQPSSAFCDEADERCVPAADAGEPSTVRIEQALENASWINAAGVGLYNFIQRRMPWAHHLYWNGLEIWGDLTRGRVGTRSRVYEKVLKEFQPDVVVSVHDCLNGPWFSEARRILGRAVRCVTYCGEFSGGYGFSRNWVSPEADAFYGRTWETVEAAVALGFPAHRCFCLGHLLHPDFYRAPMTKEAIRLFRKKEMGLEPDQFTLLLATGGAGAQNHLRFLRALRPLADRVQVVLLTRRRAADARPVLEWVKKNPQLPAVVLPFTSRMAELLQVVDVVVARPGTTTAAESLHLGTPIWFNVLGGMMPQESCTWRWFQRRGIGRLLSTPHQLYQAVRQWSEDAVYRETWLAALRHAATPDHPEALVRSMLGQSP